jgi:hypothetical protein
LNTLKMSIQAATRVSTVRRINRADSKVREGDRGVKANGEDEEKDRRADFQREEKDHKRKIRSGNIGERENEDKNTTPKEDKQARLGIEKRRLGNKKYKLGLSCPKLR